MPRLDKAAVRTPQVELVAHKHVLEPVTVHVADRNGRALPRGLIGQQRLEGEIGGRGLGLLVGRRMGPLKYRVSGIGYRVSGGTVGVSLRERQSLIDGHVDQHL